MLLHFLYGVTIPTKMLIWTNISPMTQKETKSRLIVTFSISSVTQLKW